MGGRKMRKGEALRIFKEWSDRNQTGPASKHRLDESRADFDRYRIVIRIDYEGGFFNKLFVPLEILTEADADRIILDMIETRMKAMETQK
jgi:hypothetical protein